ncbi:HAD family hydrolase [Natronospora cellulosivora (SeqCode)]
MSLEAVIFDLDNTLNNRRLAFRKYTNSFIDKYIMIENNRKELIEYIEKADEDGYRSKIEIYNELLSNLKWKKKANLDELLEFWNNQFPKCTTLMDGCN